ncbi:hypothetical protein ACS0TY_012025 [Phlomoides rotata]
MLMQNHHFPHHHLLRTVPLFTVLALTCLVLYETSTPPFFFPQSISSFSLNHAKSSTTPESNHTGKGELSLSQVLERAAMPDKTVIITTLNEAWIEPESIFDLFLKSFRIGNQTLGLLKHLVVVALDKKAFDHCVGALHLNCYYLTTEGVDFSGETNFNSWNYFSMMWRRIDFLWSVLEMGYNFVFTDADIMWLRDPFPHFYPDTKFQISCDYFWGDPSDLKNSPNGGFNYVKSSNETIKFYKFWYESRLRYPKKHDQYVLDQIKYKPFIREIGLEMKFLDTAYFGGFCAPSKDMNLACTMHANCCAGLGNKIHDLEILLEDWKSYLSLPENVRKSQTPSWSVPQSCG